jgi:RND family efflux transporter MFP subunit
MRRSIIFLSAFGLVGFAALGYATIPRSASQPGAATMPEARFILPKASAAESLLRLPARAEPYEEAVLFARASGFVAERRVDLGSRVAAGQVLAVIDTPELDADTRTAKAALERARATAALSQVNLERAESLIARGFISKAAVDERRAALRMAEADVNATRASLTRVEDLRRFQLVRAPFAGQVIERNVERGDRVSNEGGTEPLFRLARLERLRVIVDVPQGAVAIPVGTEAMLVFAEQSSRRYPVRVARTSGAIRQATGAMRLELDLDNQSGEVAAGTVGTVEFRLPRQQQALLVPNAALNVSKGITQIAILDADDRLRFRTVTPGANLGDRTEVIGVNPNYRVVLNVNALLDEGTKVRPLALPAKAE